MTIIAMLAQMVTGLGQTERRAEAESKQAYIAAYHTTGTSGTGMTYMDDSLHLAYSYDRLHWTALHDNNGILFKKNPGYRASTANGLQYRDPYLFRKQDGRFVLLATLVTSTGAMTNSALLAWDSDDLLTYSNDRQLQMNSTNTAALKPQVEYDAANDNYVIYWTDGSTVYANTTQDFVTVSAPTVYSGTGYPAAKPDFSRQGPPGATPSSVIAVSQAELDKLIASLGTPVIPTGTEPVQVMTAIGTPPVLPDTGKVVYSDGSAVPKGVTWEPIDPSRYAKPGTFQVKGKVNGSPDYVNPLIKNGADPNIYKGADGYYYYTMSYMNYANNGVAAYQYDRITLRRASTIQGLASAEEKQIWTKHASGEMSYHIWAPEIHYVNGKWYIYFAAGRTNANFDLRVYVLECSTQDPMTGDWKELGKVAMNDEAFDLDATTFEHNGELYMIYAFANGGLKINSSLRIAKMTSPTTLDSVQVNISTPEYTWEQRYDNVNEGSAVIKKNGKIFVAYSAGSTDTTYAVGLLSAPDSPDANLLDPANWTKTPYPIMATSRANGQFGPGHGTFTVAEDGLQDVFLYHARKNEAYSATGYAPLYDATRWARVQNVYWHGDGTPYLGVPVPDGPLPGASIEAAVTVVAPEGAVYPDESSFTLEAGAVRPIELRKSNGDGTTRNVTAAAVFDSSAPSVVKVSQSGAVKALSEGSSVITAQYEGHSYPIQVTVPKPVTNADLQLWYKFDETSGTNAADASGRGNDGTYVRTPAFGTGVNGGSFKMSGGPSSSTTAPYVQIPNGILKGVDDITISTYVKFTSTTTRNQFLYGLGQDSNKYIFTSPYNGSSVLHSAITTGTYTGEQKWPATSALPGNVWKQLTVVLNGEEHTGVMYLDGVEVGRNTNVTIKPSDLYDASRAYSGYIGKSFYAADPYFGGEVDDFRIFNKAMTPWEVKQSFESANVAAVAGDLEALLLGDTSAVTDDRMTLPSTGANGSSIMWQSSRPSIVEADGTVHRPMASEGSQQVTLTATIRKGSIEDTKDFVVTVVPLLPASSAVLHGAASVDSGGLLELTYGVAGVTSAVYANDLTVHFDPSRLQYQSVEALRSGISVTASTYAAASGQVRIVWASNGPQHAVSGTAELLKLSFKAGSLPQTVTSSVYLSDVIAADQLGVESRLSIGEPYQVRINAQANKSALRAAIAHAQSIYTGAVEGTAASQYPAGSKAVLNGAIQAARAIADNSTAAQQEIDRAVGQLGVAVAAFASSVITAAAGDLNGDGRFSIGDLSKAASCYGQTSASAEWSTVYVQADMNHDGKIDIADLSAISELIMSE
ncbi:hypothetical protein CF651_06115 [Paenibacillus rigui]|uniref:Dockerin domain-containing protein n=2 Tax=Paenibacillus rigui TaxID=554312 RepID=A0A229UUY1_9BACL|nr:hypothetical protein CF651_06115 [Paenibacillus rigui]